MKGSINVKTGEYAVSDNISMTIAASDEGTVITTNFLLIRQHFSITIDEHGNVVGRHASQTYRRKLQPQPKAADPLGHSSPHTPTSPSRPIARRSKLVKFTIRYGKSYRPRNVAYAVGGFTDGSVTHILYRLRSRSGTVRGQIRLGEGACVLLGKQIPSAQRLPADEWDNFAALPDNATFHMGQGWRKIEMRELGELVSGKTITPTPELG